MINNNLAEKLEQESFNKTQEGLCDSFEQNITNIAQEILDQMNKIHPANDNDPNNPDPTTPSAANKTEEFLKEWADIGSKVSCCNKLIYEKGLTPEEQEKRFQAAFTVASDYLRYEMEIGNIFNQLPSLQGSHNLEETDYSKCRYIVNVLKLPYKKAWSLSKLTPESVEKAIQYAAENKELPTSRLANLLLRYKDILELKEAILAQKEQKRLERKIKKQEAEEAKIQREIDDYNAIQTIPLLKTLPDDTYNVLYVDPSASTLSVDELKKYIIPASDNSILFMWSPANQLKERLELMETWGFQYKENAVWDRMDSAHTGQYFFNQHDLLLVGIRGEGFKPKSKEKSVCRIPLKIGETKPTYYTELVKTMYPQDPCLNIVEILKDKEN